MIKINGLHKAYGKNKVLRGVELSVEEGSIFCLLGSNGAGKTTLIKILSTLIPPDSGYASINGYDCVREGKRVREAISLTGQYSAVDGLLTARENLIMTARLFHIREYKKRADELLSAVGLADKANVRVKTFSGGMRRRLDIAMSLTANPRVVFLDEPTTGLDPQSRLEMWDMVRGMAKAGVTVFLTTQYLEECEQLADKIAILHEGKIIRQGSAAELKSLVSESRVELTFENLELLDCAMRLLDEFSVEQHRKTLSLSIKTDGSTDMFRDILNALKGVEILAANQHRASLEEVFIKLVSGGRD